MPTKHRVAATRLENHGRNVRWKPKAAYRPGRGIKGLSSLLATLDKRLADGVKVKAGGSRHAWSPTAATDGVYIHPEGMRFIEKPDARTLKRGAQHKGLFRIGSGTTVKQINESLWKVGKSLPVLGGFDGQTLGGVLPTGTHGSVLKHGPMIDMVESLDLVTAKGERVRIEPAGGITDPRRFRTTNPGWKLIQSNRVFDASLINMGTFGVVHSYVIRAQDRFYLNEIRTQTTGVGAQKVLRGGNIYRIMDAAKGSGMSSLRSFQGHPERNYHMELLWNIHSDRMVVTSRNPLNKTQSTRLSRNEPGYFDGTRNKSLLRPLFMKKAFSRPHGTELLAEHAPKLLGRISELVARVAPRLMPKVIDLSLRGLLDTGYTQRSYRVFNIGDGANKIPAQSATLSVPLRGDRYLRAMDVMRVVAKQFAAEHGDHHTGPVSLRFVKGNRAALGDPEDVCKFEIIFAGDRPKSQKLARELVWRHYQALHKELGSDVRFHWGQLIPGSFTGVAKDRIRASYPKAASFERIRKQFDPKGRFKNDWQDALLP